MKKGKRERRQEERGQPCPCLSCKTAMETAVAHQAAQMVLANSAADLGGGWPDEVIESRVALALRVGRAFARGCAREVQADLNMLRALQSQSGEVGVMAAKNGRVH
jgi:hypothetical protein